jgi:hypothetical protein
MKPTKKLLIDQPAGIGDILFIQKIVKTYSEEYQIDHPVKDSISWITKYVPGTMTKDECSGPYDKVLYLETADRNYSKSKIMEAKYKLAQVDMTDFMDYIEIHRDEEMEGRLYEAIAPIKPYRLVCPWYGTPEKGSSGMFKIDIPHSNTIHNVVMNLRDGYTLFDWLRVIEEAEEIYTTDSAIMFLIEKYACKAKKLVAYSRRSSASEVDYLFRKPWEHICRD